MSESLYLLSISLVLVTILLVFGMRAFSAVQQAKFASKVMKPTARSRKRRWPPHPRIRLRFLPSRPRSRTSGLA